MVSVEKHIMTAPVTDFTVFCLGNKALSVNTRNRECLPVKNCASQL